MSRDPRIDRYIAKSAPFARPILLHLRDLVHTACPEARETIKWGFPHFEHNGLLCSMAAFKAHCAFGFWHQDMEAIIGADGGKSGSAMGHMGRITSVKDLPPNATMRRYIREAAKLNDSCTPARRRPKTKVRQDLVVPDDLASALKRSKTAAVVFEKFTYSNRKEYIEWITEAKRPETRTRRLETALQWIAEGKPRNWQYMNC